MPSPTDSLRRSFGALSTPIQAGDVVDGQLFSVFDPAIDRLVAFCKAVIEAELADAWDAVNASLTTDSLRGKSVVGDTLYVEPRKGVLREGNFSFPLLAVYRGDERHSYINLRDRKAEVDIMIDYILPPMTVEDERRVVAVLNAVSKVLTSAFEEMGHPAYNGGNAVFFYSDRPKDAIFASLGTRRVQFGRAAIGEDGEGAEYAMVKITLQAVEHDGHTLEETCEGTPMFDAVHAKLHAGGEDGSIESLVEVEAP